MSWQRICAKFPASGRYPSATNFLLVELPVEDAGPVVAELAERGILVRHFANPALGLASCLRVTIGFPEENEAVPERACRYSGKPMSAAIDRIRRGLSNGKRARPGSN